MSEFVVRLFDQTGVDQHGHVQVRTWAELPRDLNLDCPRNEVNAVALERNQTVRLCRLDHGLTRASWGQRKGTSS